MPIPFIIAGVALAAGAYGVKKGFDAKSDFNDANETNALAQQIYDDSARKLETTREKTQDSLQALGELKFDLYQNKLIPFVAAFKKIHNIDFQHDAIEDEFQLTVDHADMADIENATLKMTDIVSGGIMSLGTGGLAGLAAYGSVGLLASTAGGTAIGSLSGVAATNATLAWLGGGALSAGGLGMAGGAYVLGSIVAGPVLAVGGMMLASKAEEAKHNAYSNLSIARVAAEQMEAANVAAQGVHTRIKEIHQVLSKLDDTFEPLLKGLQGLVGLATDAQQYSTGKVDYTTLPKENQIGIMAAMMMAKTIKNVLETPMLKGLQGLVTDAQQYLTKKVDYTTLPKENQIGIMAAMMMAKTIKNVLETPILDEQGLLTQASGEVIDAAYNNLLDVQERLA